MKKHHTDIIRLVVSRPCLVFGQPCHIGDKVELPPLAALDAVETGRLEFVDHGDRQRCMEARRAEIAKQTRRVAPPPDGFPWQPSRFS